MDLKDSRESSNVEDVRDQGRGPGPGGDPFGRRGVNIPIGNMRGGSIGSIVLIIIVVIVLQFMGVDVGSLLGDGTTSRPSDSQTVQSQQSNDESLIFVRKILGETEDAWNGIFAAAGERYVEPKLVLVERIRGEEQDDDSLGKLFETGQSNLHVSLNSTLST